MIYYTITRFSRGPQDTISLTYGGQYFRLQDMFFFSFQTSLQLFSVLNLYVKSIKADKMKKFSRRECARKCVIVY